MSTEFRGWRILHPSLNEEPSGVWWANGQVEHIATGDLETVAVPNHFAAREDAFRAYLMAARARIAEKS